MSWDVSYPDWHALTIAKFHNGLCCLLYFLFFVSLFVLLNLPRFEKKFHEGNYREGVSIAQLACRLVLSQYAKLQQHRPSTCRTQMVVCRIVPVHDFCIDVHATTQHKPLPHNPRYKVDGQSGQLTCIGLAAAHLDS